MHNENLFKQNINVVKANQVLAENGLNISEEQTKAVVDYLYGLAYKFINHEKSNAVHPSEHR